MAIVTNHYLVRVDTIKGIGEEIYKIWAHTVDVLSQN